MAWTLHIYMYDQAECFGCFLSTAVIDITVRIMPVTSRHKTTDIWLLPAMLLYIASNVRILRRFVGASPYAHIPAIVKARFASIESFARRYHK